MFENSNNKIKSVKARQILDSRGNPTVETEILTAAGRFIGAVPSGASTGAHEACELRDGDANRFGGAGVLTAVGAVNDVIASKIVGTDARDQKKIDDLMIGLDGTQNKSKLGANAICSVSMAVAKAGAGKDFVWRHVADLAQNEKPGLPKAGFNIINGGAHAGNELDVQEFMVVPQFEKFSENLRTASEVYHRLKSILGKKFGKPATNLGDEGGFAPSLKTPEEALSLIMEAISSSGNAKDNTKIIMDVASTQFFDNGTYKMHLGEFGAAQLADYYKKLAAQFPIIGFEDPFAEDDWGAWTAFKPEGVLVIGDDLLVTNPGRIKEAREKNACNAMILKINQIGSVSEGMEAARLAKSFGWKIVVSHRSGETNDDFIADFAVGIGAEFIKSGAPARGERLAKYNRLVRIEEELKL